MSKYTEEFRRNAIELMKKVGITQAAKELKVAHCTIYRWCRELEGMTPGEPEEIGSTDVDKLIEDQEKGEHPSEPSHQEQMGKEQTVAPCFRRFPACAVGRAGAIGQAEADQPGA